MIIQEAILHARNNGKEFIKRKNVDHAPIRVDSDLHYRRIQIGDISKDDWEAYRERDLMRLNLIDKMTNYSGI